MEALDINYVFCAVLAIVSAYFCEDNVLTNVSYLTPFHISRGVRKQFFGGMHPPP